MHGLSNFNFDLPPHLIAQKPNKNRTDSRLLIFKNGMTSPLHAQFKNLIDHLNPGDALVLNNTKVIPARFIGHKSQTKGKVEILLSRILPDGTWVSLISTKRKLSVGTEIILKENVLTAKVLARIKDEPGAYQISFNEDILHHAEVFGQIPLPPYINRSANEEDKIRYQTVFADPKQNQAVAAPTAGLHFDEALIEQIKNKRIHIIYITLHVGPGTFLPLRTENFEEHKMHAEPWEISEESAKLINQVKKNGGRIIAVGTTSVRTLESAFDAPKKQVNAGTGLTKLFIKPGFQFNVVDGFITNFHLPKTTLLLLVAAAIGERNLNRIYQEAINKEYHFFSYGDACLFDVIGDML